MARVIRSTNTRKRKQVNILPPKFFNRKIISWLVVFAIAIGGIAFYQAYNAYANPIEKDLIPLQDSKLDSGTHWNVAEGWNEGSTPNWVTGAPDAAEDYTGTAGGSWKTLKANTVLDSVYIWHSFKVPDNFNQSEDGLKATFYYKKQIDDPVTQSNVKWKLTSADGTEVISAGIVDSETINPITGWEQKSIDIKGMTTLTPGATYRLYLEHEAEAGEAGSVQVNFDMARVIWTYSPKPIVSGISASLATIPNDNATTTQITATVVDQSGSPLANEPVFFSASEGVFVESGDVDTATVNTNVYGKAVVRFKSDAGGEAIISAEAQSSTAQTKIVILHPSSVTVKASKKTIPAGNDTPSKITARIFDQNNNPMSNVKVTFSKSLETGSFKVGESVYGTTAEVTTGSDGVAEALFTSNAGDTYTITATADGASGNETVSVQKPTNLTITPSTAEPVVISNKTGSKVELTAVLNDQDGKPIPNKLISFTKSPNSGNLSGTGVKTDANGTVKLSFSSDVGKTYQITGRVSVPGDSDITDTLQVKVQEPTNLTFTANDDTLTNNKNAYTEITAKLVDQNGTAIQDEEITLSTSSGTLNVSSGTTNADGEVKYNFKPQTGTAGGVTISGAINRSPGLHVIPADVDVINYSPAKIEITASPNIIPDDNYISSTAVAVLLDQKDFPIEGETVNFTETRGNGGGFTSASSVVTNSSGKAQIGYRSGNAGAAEIKAVVGAVHKEVPITVAEREVGSIVLTADMSHPVIPNNNTTEISMKARLVDQLGYPLSGENVNFSSQSGTLSNSSVESVNGEAIVKFKSSVAGKVQITASAGGKSDSIMVDVQTRVPTTLTLTSNPEIVIINETGALTITADLKDQFGQPIAGKNIKFGYAWGKYQSTVATNAGGKAQITISELSKVGLMTVTARVEDMPFISGITAVEYINSDETPPKLVSAQATSKQIVYLTFSERIKTSPVNWELKSSRDGAVGSEVYNIPADNIKILPGDQKIIRILLPYSMETGNQKVQYTAVIQGVTDLNGNQIENQADREASWDAFTPHGKYSPYNETAGSTAMVCARCHSAHSAEGEKLLAKKTVSEVCFVCHDDTGGSQYNIKAQYSRGAGNVAKSMHNALDLGSTSENPSVLTCVDCHDPHGIKSGGATNDILPKLLATKNPDQELVTSADGNYFCLACHGEKPTGSEFHSKFGDYWSKTFGDYRPGMEDDSNGKPKAAHYDLSFDTLKPDSGTNITCLKCHESHGSKNNNLIDNNVPNDQTIADNDKDLCYKCHDTSSNSMSKIDIKSDFSKESYHDISNSDVGLGCRSCHEPHTVADRDFKNSGTAAPSDISKPSNTKKNFVKTSEVRFSQFCLECHNKESGEVLTQVADTNTLVPFTITLPKLLFSGPGWNKTDFFGSVHAQTMECNDCHVSHGSDNSRLGKYGEDAIEGGSLVKGECLRCHSSGSGAQGENVYNGGFDQNYTHNTLTVNGEHSDTEKYDSIVRHAECYDCHDPHTAKSEGSATAKLGNVLGVLFGSKSWNNWNDAEAEEITLGGSDGLQAYLCYKCHSKYSNQPSSQTDVARDMNPANAARHVVEGSSQMPKFTYNGNSEYYGAFVNGAKATDKMKCTSCHSGSNNESPHGSNNAHILKRPWSSDTGKSGSSSNLCFECHSYEFYGDGGSGNETKRSQFSNENLGDGEGNSSDNRFNLHAAPGHANAGCASCHGSIPHGWNKKDSSGNGGLSLWDKESDVQSKYKTGVKIDEISGSTTPGQWQRSSCVTSCHAEPEEAPEETPETP